MSKHKWGAILGGGSALGAVQPPILRKLREEYGCPPSGLACVSVGAVNGAKAGEDDLDTLDSEWDRVDGVESFARRTIPGVDLFRSLEPLRRRLEATQAAARLVCPVWVGLVDVASESYRAVALHELPNLADRWDAIIGSARQPLLMVEETFQGRPVMDGGAGGHVLPPLPNWSEMDSIHVISCSPVGAGRRRTPKPVDKARGPWTAATAAFRLMMSRQVNEDVEDLQDQCAEQVPTYLYAPERWEDVRDPFEAERSDVALRRATARMMYAGRERLTRPAMRRPR